MIIADKNNFVTFEDAEKKYNGGCSEIFVKDDLAIKRYYDDRVPPYFGRIESDVFDSLKGIESNCFIDLKECFTKDVIIDNHYENVVTGYTYKYVNALNKRMIDMPIDYTLKTLYEFRLLLESLNVKHLAIKDNNAGNVVVADNHLVIIDPDAYCFDDIACKDNLKRLNDYVAKLWFQEYGIYDIKTYEKIRNIFSYNDKEDYIMEMYDKFHNEATPRDILNKTLNRK